MQRRKFSREFKIEAVRFVGERGVSVAEASRDLDVHENVVELLPKVGEGMNRGRRHIVGVFKPPLLHRRSDMPCPTITLSNLIQPEILTDRLTEVLRDGARALLTQAVEAEVSEFLATTADLKTDDGCRRVVRHGHLPERQIMTGIGPVAVRQPRVRDREAGADASRTGPRSPWSSSWSKARRRPGVALTATTSCQRSFEV